MNKPTTVAFILALAAAGAAAGAGAARAAGDVEAGKKVFRKCAICHSTEPGQNKIGPSLFGVVGRKAGSLPDYNYSQAMETSGITWTPANLDAFIEAPRKVVPGTRMAFPGIRSAEDRQNLIAYLETLH